MDPLSARVITDATLYPTIRVASHPGKLLMGVFDDGGDLVPGTVLDRRAGEQGAPVPAGLLPAPVPAAEPEAIYAGPLYFHFGHFLLESLARAWYTRERPDLPFVWAGAHTWQKMSLKQWQLDILDILGITAPARIVADPTRFGRLHVPDIGYRYDDTFHPEHAAYLGRYEGPPQEAGARLWLSRNKLSTEWRDINAGPTERHLAAAGWNVMSPEQLSVRQQLDEFSRAEVIAGEEGSAFHSIMLLRDVSSKRLEILRRLGPEHGNLHTIGNRRQVTQHFHTLTNERVLEATGRYVSKMNPNSSEIMDVLQVPVPAPPAVEPGRSDAATASLITKAKPKRVLTVGHKHLPTALEQVQAVVAVSTRFDFDPRSRARDGRQFFELDLAQYAEHFHDRDQRFDVIWIQAPNFEKFVAAFDVSTALAADDALWLVGVGKQAARAALAVELTRPGYTVASVTVDETTVLTVRRQVGAPVVPADLAGLSDRQVERRLYSGLPHKLRRLRRRTRRRLARLRRRPAR